MATDVVKVVKKLISIKSEVDKAMELDRQNKEDLEELQSLLEMIIGTTVSLASVKIFPSPFFEKLSDKCKLKLKNMNALYYYGGWCKRLQRLVHVRRVSTDIKRIRARLDTMITVMELNGLATIAANVKATKLRLGDDKNVAIMKNLFSDLKKAGLEKLAPVPEADDVPGEDGGLGGAEEAKFGRDDLEVGVTLQDLRRWVRDAGRPEEDAEVLFKGALEVERAKKGLRAVLNAPS